MRNIKRGKKVNLFQQERSTQGKFQEELITADQKQSRFLRWQSVIEDCFGCGESRAKGMNMKKGEKFKPKKAIAIASS